MRAVQYIEIDLDHCALTYGTAPCTASLVSSPPTGDHKCFNTPKTCQDRANYSNSPITLRFAVPTAYLPSNIEAIPSIASITMEPGTISLGEDLGQRATLTVVFTDHRHSDTPASLFDKNLASRSYDPFKQGTFFGRFRARHPYVFGRPLRWINGFVGQALAEMETRHYVIDTISGPNADGDFTLIAKDVLALVDDGKAQAPKVNSGFLTANISSSATTATLSPSGIGNAEYPSGTFFVAIGGSEICAVSRSGDTLTLLARGALGTTADSHNADDRVQFVLTFGSSDPANIIAYLFINYGNVPSGFIPLSDWLVETGTYLNRLYSAVIPNPTDVDDLVSELIEQAGLSLWWDDRNQQIGLKVLRGQVAGDIELSENTVDACSLDISEQPDLRLSQVHTYFAQINSLTSLTDKSNYGSVAILVDSQAETDYGSAAIKEIFSRWIPAGGRTVADRINSITLARFRDPPRHFKFSVLRASLPEILLAKAYNISSWALQDDQGAPASPIIQITRLNPAADLIDAEGDEVLFITPVDDLNNRNIVFDSNLNNVNGRSQHDLLFPAPTSGITVTFTINAGVVIGSGSPGSPSFDVGTWPAGVTIKLVVAGTIEGAGGAGGNATQLSSGIAGGGGGTALYTRTAISLDVSAGAIWGGGGGGGGAGGTAYGGGGGGAGTVPGGAGTGASGGAGSAGTATAGGIGGKPPVGSQTGGNGGAPGNAGTAGSTINAAGGAGGAAGAAVDGISHVTVTAGPGDVRGPEVN